MMAMIVTYGRSLLTPNEQRSPAAAQGRTSGRPVHRLVRALFIRGPTHTVAVLQSPSEAARHAPTGTRTTVPFGIG